MGPKTLRRLVVAAVVLVLGVVSIFLLQRYQMSRMGRSNLERAQQAVKDGDLAKAEDLYLQHVLVFPKDDDAQIEYAKVVVQRSKTAARTQQASQIYREILSRQPGRDDVRRQLAELIVDSFGENPSDAVLADARAFVTPLEKTFPNDGDVAYMIGRYRQGRKEDKTALEAYKKAIDLKSEKRFDAYQRIAALYRGPLGRPEEADRIIDEMVKNNSANNADKFRAYLERGRYRERNRKPEEDPSASIADFKEAMKWGAAEPEPYLELAAIELRMTQTAKTPAEVAKHREAAQQILDQGLKASPKSGRLYLAFAQLTSDAETRLKILRTGITELPDDPDLRFLLADVLAVRGATTELETQAQELQRLGYTVVGDYYAAYAQANARDWTTAKKNLLDKVVSKDAFGNNPMMRSRVSLLLAKCYGAVGDVERQRTALAAAVRDDPNNGVARATWIADLAAQGEIDRAIAEYRAMASIEPAVRPELARLLVERNLQLEPGQRDWREVTQVLDRIEADDPGFPPAVVLRARMKAAQGLGDEAAKLLADEAAKLLADAHAKGRRDTGAVFVWTTSAEFQAAKRDYEGALKTLEEARVALGDSDELRLARLRILTARKAPDLKESLIALTKGDESLRVEQRIAVLDAVAETLARMGERTAAAEIWNRHAELAPNDLDPRVRLLDLALTPDEKKTDAADVARRLADIKKAVDEIRRAEGSDGSLSRYAEIEMKIWQAKHSDDDAEKAKFRNDARTQLAELRSRRPDWSIVPLTTARLEELELDQAKDETDRKRRLGRVADLYRQAVDLGRHDLAVVQKATELLMQADRTSEVGPLWNKVPRLNADTADSNAVERAILGKVLEDKDAGNLAGGDRSQALDKIVDIVRERVAARPKDFAEAHTLAQLLVLRKKPEEAEDVIRRSIAAVPDDPNRRIVLVQLLAAGSQFDKAEQAVAQLERAVPAERLPLALAECANLIAQGCGVAGREAQKAKWFAVAKSSFIKAQAAEPKLFALKRRYIEFLLRFNEVDEVEKELRTVLNAAAEPTSGVDPADAAWAKRTLAMTYVIRAELTGDYQQALKALALYQPQGGAERPAVDEAEDLRILARVYESQRMVGFRRQAIEILERLDAQHRASDDDRFLLAKLYRADNHWDKAHVVFTRLVEEARKPSSVQELYQQMQIASDFVSTLIDKIQAAGGKPAGDVAEAQELIEKLRKIQPDGFNVLAFQARLDKATGKLDQAEARLKELADRPQLPTALAIPTARLAETLGLYDMAERILRRNAMTFAQTENQLEFAAFLGRRDRIKDALDVCDPLWRTASPTPEPIAPTVIAILLSSKTFNDPVQISRVSGWIERSLQQHPNSPLLMIALGTIRDRQLNYPEAIKLYAGALSRSSGEVVPLNNLAWLMTLKGEKGAAPLDLINRAINIRGPAPEFLDTRAVVYLTNGEARKAIEDLENAVAMDPTASRYFHLARAYMEAGDLEAARKSLVKAHDRGLSEADVHPLERAAFTQVEKALK
ncbi:tetratricopeptide repeat protein [Paludisphaera rhizosphaerae]|uniref:tetratricopeptide repeat protein n=1 Tax=Paludisphaera rhizosphaerae TaxID=2711216 RepID=UPI0013EAEF42|nr:hypothetical protein [Paludisphaera rhizosphaerae]